MRSKFEFDPTDFEGCGQMVIRESSSRGSKDGTFAATVSYKIGWMPKMTGTGNEIVLVSLADGMCQTFDSLEELCKRLNNDECGYRPMSDAEITKVMLSQHNRFTGNGGV